MSKFDPLQLPLPRSASLSLRQPHALQTELTRPGAADDSEDEGIDIRQLLRLVYKHKWTLTASGLLCTAIAVIYGLTNLPVYRATALLQIDRPSTARIVNFKGADAMDVSDSQDLPTQYGLLRSRVLAERVIDELGLDKRVGAKAPSSFGLSSKMPETSPSAVASRSAGSASESVNGGFFSNLSDKVLRGYERSMTPSVTDANVLDRQGVVSSVLASVQINPVPQTRLVQINVENTRPELAARIANTYATSFIAMTIERRSGSSDYAKTFLEDQLKQTKVRLEASERQLNSYAKSNSILTLDEKTNVVNQTFTEYSAALSKAEQDRIKAEAAYRQIAETPESATQVLESKTVQSYKEQKAKLEADYLQNLSIYKPEFPKMVQLRSQIAEIDTRIKAEVAMVLVSIKGQFEGAKKQEEQIRARLGETRKEVLVAQDRGVDLNLLRRELDTNRQIYDSLLQRLKEVGVTAEVAPNNISIVDVADVPLFPFKPRPLLNAAIGLAAGLLLGFAFVFVREHMDDSIKNADEVEKVFGLALLGIIPAVKKKQVNERALALLINDDPRSAFAEAYRSMRTALQFSTNEGAPRRIMVTSCVKGEGKSTTALALDINFAQLGKKVLLIDADMRSPSTHRALELRNEYGLSNFLSGHTGRETLIQPSGILNLEVMTAGPTPPNSADLLMGPKLLMLLDKADEMGFHQVIIDAPPILGIADSIVLGNQVQNILFVVRSANTRKSSIKDALRRLRIAGLAPLGAALTQASSQNTLIRFLLRIWQ
jgi:succinoglycan biosynthesis transport protein ExoP